MPMCRPDQLECTRNLTVDNSKCLYPCEGLYTKYIKTDIKDTLKKEFLGKVMDDYEQYKGYISYSENYRGTLFSQKFKYFFIHMVINVIKKNLNGTATLPWSEYILTPQHMTASQKTLLQSL